MGNRTSQMGGITGRVLISGALVADVSAEFPAEAAQDSQVSVTVPEVSDPVQAYKIVVHNPSTVSAVKIKLYTVEADFGGADRDSYIDEVVIPVSSTEEVIVGGLFCGGALKLVASNNTVLGAGDAFTASVRIREV